VKATAGVARAGIGRPRRDRLRNFFTSGYGLPSGLTGSS
jgi:hypothetical protein